MVATSAYKITSMIGGISEQSPQDRPTACAEDELNIDAVALKGARARNGSEVLNYLSETFEDPFVHDVVRSSTEHYKVLVEGGRIVVVNLVNGQPCIVSNFDLVADYFAHTGPARLAFAAVTVEDDTFIVNTQKTVAMNADKTEARQNQAIFYLKAAAYSTVYTMTIKVDGKSYSATYETPDNSAFENAKYIDTGTLAEEFAQRLSTVTGLTSRGFTFSANGSMVIVDGADNSFTVDSKDGQGDTHLISFKDWVRKYADLPARAPSGYTVGVRGSKADQKDDYWVRYSGTAMTGRWVEIAKPGITYKLDETTMPVLLKSRAKEVFTMLRPTWGERLVGDGDKSSPDPEFIGEKLISIHFIAGRLLLCTSGSASMSRAKNSYVYFPDTAQARLATDPIGLEIQNGKVTIIRSTVAVSEKLFLWGHQTQLRLDSGDGPHSEENTEALPSTNYEYDGQIPPVAIGMSSVVFGTQNDTGIRLLEVMYRNGSAIGEIPLTDHVPELLEGELRSISSGSASGVLAVTTTGMPEGLYLYRWLNQGDKRVQTAWTRWTLPGISKVISASVNASYLYLLLQMGNRTVIERVRLNPGRGPYKDIRLDHRLTDAYSDIVDEGETLLLNLPYAVPEEIREEFVCVDNEDDPSGNYRGGLLEMEWVSNMSVRITPGASGKFFFGARVPAWRKLSELFIQTEGGTVYAEDALVVSIKVSYSETTQFRVEVRDKEGAVITSEPYMNSRFASMPHVRNGRLPSISGVFKVPVGGKADEVDIFLINDSIFSSTWTGMDYEYSINRR